MSKMEMVTMQVSSDDPLDIQHLHAFGARAENACVELALSCGPGGQFIMCFLAPDEAEELVTVLQNATEEAWEQEGDDDA
jgi:hypothetical protein